MLANRGHSSAARLKHLCVTSLTIFLSIQDPNLAGVNECHPPRRVSGLRPICWSHGDPSIMMLSSLSLCQEDD